MTWGLWGIGVPGPGERTAMANFSDYADAPRDEQGRILLHRGVGIDFPHMTFRRGPDPTGETHYDWHYTPPEHWDEAMDNIRSESDGRENYGNWWGDQHEARAYAGNHHGAMTVSAWWHPHDLQSTGGGRDGLWAKEGAQGEVAQAHIYHREHGWVPLPGSAGRAVTAHRTASYGFQKGEMPYAGGHRAEAFDPDTGETVGYLEHDRDSGEVSSIWVHPDHRGRGIATDLFDWTRSYVNSRLRHSDDLTDEGRAWAESMGHDTGNARTVQWPTAHRTAARDLDGIEFGLTPGEHGGSTPQPYDRHMETAAVDTASGRQVGWLSRRPTGEIYEVSVHPDYRRRGIATALFDWTKANVDPELHHSTDMTDEGAAWAATMGWTPDHYNEKQMPAVFHPIEQMPIHEGPTYRHAHRTAMPSPPSSSSLPSVGHCGNNWWGEGGCGHLALAFANMYPDMKIGAEYDPRFNSVNHAWAYGPDGRSHDFMGTHDGHPPRMDRGGEIREDVSPEDLAADMRIDYNPDEDHRWDNPEIAQAGHLINRHWHGDDDYGEDSHDGYYDPDRAENRGTHRTAMSYWVANGSEPVHHIPTAEALSYRQYDPRNPPDIEKSYPADWSLRGDEDHHMDEPYQTWEDWDDWEGDSEPPLRPSLRDQISSEGITSPVEILTDGQRAWLGDGIHRTTLAGELGMSHVPAHVIHMSPEDLDFYANESRIMRRKTMPDAGSAVLSIVNSNKPTPASAFNQHRKARTMTAAVTVYTQPNCVQCTMTKKQLDKLGIEHSTVDVSADPEAHAYVTGLGYTAAPVVVVNNGESHWAGFRPERLKALSGE